MADFAERQYHLVADWDGETPIANVRGNSAAIAAALFDIQVDPDCESGTGPANLVFGDTGDVLAFLAKLDTPDHREPLPPTLAGFLAGVGKAAGPAAVGNALVSVGCIANTYLPKPGETFYCDVFGNESLTLRIRGLVSPEDPGITPDRDWDSEVDYYVEMTDGDGGEPRECGVYYTRGGLLMAMIERDLEGMLRDGCAFGLALDKDAFFAELASPRGWGVDLRAEEDGDMSSVYQRIFYRCEVDSECRRRLLKCVDKATAFDEWIADHLDKDCVNFADSGHSVGTLRQRFD